MLGGVEGPSLNSRGVSQILELPEGESDDDRMKIMGDSLKLPRESSNQLRNKWVSKKVVLEFANPKLEKISSVLTENALKFGKVTAMVVANGNHADIIAPLSTFTRLFVCLSDLMHEKRSITIDLLRQSTKATTFVDKLLGAWTRSRLRALTIYKGFTKRASQLQRVFPLTGLVEN